MRCLLLASFVAALPGPSTAKAEPNWAMCAAIQNNYNNCLAHRRGPHGWGGQGGPYGHGGPRPRGGDCSAWLAVLKQNRCF